MILECETESSIKRGECNTTSGVAVDIITKSFFDKESCSCKKVENATERMCGEEIRSYLNINKVVEVLNMIYISQIVNTCRCYRQ